MSASDSRVRVAAPAKINLYLHVTGRRPDGYHLLDSLVTFAELADEVEVRPSGALRLSVNGPFAEAVGPVDDNLVIRAARALAARLGRAPEAAITLTKKVPVAAGLGGGSADAAATLLALCRLWKAPLARADLLAVGSRLGADVPVCLQGRPMRVHGIGELLQPAPRLPSVPVVLVCPHSKLPTPEVFSTFSGPFSRPSPIERDLAEVESLARALAQRANDLTEPASELCPEVRTVLHALGTTPECRLARMSGSGPSCFGVYDHAAAATTAARALAGRGWWVAASRTMRSSGGASVNHILR
ncbi:MAG: 4-(cytidine 5'-diphospho)-2-C-methyl-D-erythritol kinase [Alphaproteobacteria bacterium]